MSSLGAAATFDKGSAAETTNPEICPEPKIHQVTQTQLGQMYVYVTKGIYLLS